MSSELPTQRLPAYVYNSSEDDEESLELIKRLDHQFKIYMESHRDIWPLEKIPRNFIPASAEDRPRLVHYGIGVPLEALLTGGPLLEYARKYNLEHPPSKSEVGVDGVALWWTAENCVKHLSAACSYKLGLIIPAATDYNCLITLYNNYDVKYNAMHPDEEDKILQMLRTVLWDPNQIPMWYYDAIERHGRVTRARRALK